MFLDRGSTIYSFGVAVECFGVVGFKRYMEAQ
jgi:hypothetical protein